MAAALALHCCFGMALSFVYSAPLLVVACFLGIWLWLWL